MNELILADGSVNLEVLQRIPPEVINTLQMQYMQKTLSNLSMELAKISDTQLQQNEKIEYIAEAQHQNHLALLEKINFNNSENWNNLMNLGAMNNPSLSNRQMSLLMRKVGILNTKKDADDRYLPYHKFLDGKNPLAKKIPKEIERVNQYGERFIINKFDNIYHSVRTWNYIKSKLDDYGYLIDFENIKNKEEMKDFLYSLPILNG